MISSGEAYFLSRPRRFGKSLLLSTIEAVFQGKKELFEGLAISHTGYDFCVYPIIHLDFSASSYKTKNDVDSFLKFSFKLLSRKLHIDIDESLQPAQQLHWIMQELKSKCVILIDEYDKPILDTISNPEECLQVKERLKEFYSAIKAADANIQFVFLTGVSKFAKISVFSGLNNLVDLTMDSEFNNLCGYSKQEIESTFSEEITTTSTKLSMSKDQFFQRMQEWYNGYRFSVNAQTVYNPVSVMNLLRQARFGPWWFETAPPTFLIDLIESGHILPNELENLSVSESDLGSFEIDNLRIEPLLFQTGYTTITDYNQSRQTYTLSYPNREVRESFLYSLSSSLTGAKNGKTAAELINLTKAINDADIDSFMESLKVFFSGIPYDIQIKNEKYYQSIFYLVFSLLGYRISGEHRTNKGRIDAVIETNAYIFLFEFKLFDTAEAALTQIKQTEYFQKFSSLEKEITLIGVEFSPQERNISRWIVEDLE